MKSSIHIGPVLWARLAVARADKLDRASVLMLFPAAFLIVLVLGALAIDSAMVFLHQRELNSAASAAANDAIALAVDVEATRAEGRVIINPAKLEVEIHDSLARRGVLPNLVEPPLITFEPPDQVTVDLASWASYIISPALPGNKDGTLVRVSATARLVVDDG